MPDIVDDAQHAEAMFRLAALTPPRREQEFRPLEIDGCLCCCDCEEPISLARLWREK